MDKAMQTMIENLHKNTGKSLEQWIELVNLQNFVKHGEIIKYLKDSHAMTHGFANLIAHKARASDAGSAENQDDLITRQYAGKEHLRPIYDKVITAVNNFGSDIEIAPKNNYVSLRRKKQFAILQPATKSRFEIGLNMKGVIPKGRLEEIRTENSMCSHKVNVTDIAELDNEVISWIKLAYEKAE